MHYFSDEPKTRKVSEADPIFSLGVAELRALFQGKRVCVCVFVCVFVVAHLEGSEDTMSNNSV